MRHVRALGIVTLTALAVLAARRPALAQSAPSSAAPQASERIELLVEQGIALRRSGSDGRALVVFQQAERLAPESARIQVHLAATHQALGEWEAADRYLSRALAQPGDPYIVKHQTTLAAARRAIDAHIGTLEVMGKPAGAEVRLNGRLLGTLPLQQPARLEAGIYALEVTLPGHYPVTRSVALAGGHLARETVTLAPRSAAASAAPAAGVPLVWRQPEAGPERSATWLTWTLAGASVAAAGASVAFWATREKHAEHWNDNDRCQGGGQTRDALCGHILDRGESAETWMYVAGGASASFAVGAVLQYWLHTPEQAATAADTLACGIGPASFSCAGQF